MIVCSAGKSCLNHRMPEKPFNRKSQNWETILLYTARHSGIFHGERFREYPVYGPTVLVDIRPPANMCQSCQAVNRPREGGITVRPAGSATTVQAVATESFTGHGNTIGRAARVGSALYWAVHLRTACLQFRVNVPLSFVSFGSILGKMFF